MIYAKKIAFIFLFLLACSAFFGQGNGNGNNGGGLGNSPNGPPGQQGCWPPPCVPIDGGLGFLIAIGAAFGGKKTYDSLKKKD